MGANTDITQASSLSASELKAIGKKVDFQLIERQYQMLKIGPVVGSIGSLIVISSFYQHVLLSHLLFWLIAITLINCANFGLAFYFQRQKEFFTSIRPWQWTNRIINALVCLLWGSIAILFFTNDIHFQFYLLFTLFVALICLGLGNALDFIAAAFGIVCLLIPYTFFWIYLSINPDFMHDNYTKLNLQFSISLCVLGLFLIIISFISYKLIKRIMTLSFVNAALGEKLEAANAFLEQRVKERTAELETSLKLVTHQATHDLLTDLPNPRLLLEYMQMAIKLANEKGHLFAVVFLSLNEIERVNDGLGHQVGDLVIKTIAQRFQNAFDKLALDDHNTIHYTITISRKDELVILIEPIYNFDEIDASAEIFFSILDEPIYTEKQSIKLTASIGVSLYPRDGTDIKSLLMNADAAMMQAKQAGGNNLNAYKAEINADISKQLEMGSYLHTAIKNKEFLLHYQPFVDLKTGQICGMEALARWNHPMLGIVSPVNFIPLAEANGIIIPLGEWVLKTACEQTKFWHDKGFTSLKVAVNLSSKQLRQKNIVQVITDIVKAIGLKPEYLELELTESEAFKEDVAHIIKQLKALGFGLSIDDFGTGYSGLSNLKQFKIDKLKIDKSFVDDVETSSNSRAIVANIIALAKKLKIEVLAEGVETKAQLKILQEGGCDMIQGYYFSKPIDSESFTELLMSKRSLVFDEV